MADTVYGTQFMESSFNKNVAALADEYGRNVWSTAFQESAAPLTKQYEQSLRDYEVGSSELKTDYSEAINAAYDQYVYNKRAVDFSNLGTGDQLAFSEAYKKAYEKNKKQYYSDYLSAQGKLNEQFGKTTESYENALYDIMSNIAGQQSDIAKNSASVLSEFYNYAYELAQDKKDDEYLFGPTSPLYNMFVSNDGVEEFISPSEFYERFSQVDDQGNRKLTNDFEQLVKFMNNLETIVGKDDLGNEHKTYGGGFSEYLLGKDKKLFDWYSQNRDLLYKDILGLDNYDYYNPKDYKYADTLAADELKTDYLFKSGKAVNDTLAGTLDALKKGDGKQQVVYRGKVYVYDGSNWTETGEKYGYERIKLDRGDSVEIAGKYISPVSNEKITVDVDVKNQPYNIENRTVTVDGTKYKIHTSLPNETKDILSRFGTSSNERRVVSIDGRTYALIDRMVGYEGGPQAGTRGSINYKSYESIIKDENKKWKTLWVELVKE